MTHHNTLFLKKSACIADPSVPFVRNVYGNSRQTGRLYFRSLRLRGRKN